ncbi:unnamed protein product [Paramecium pentaurelia]|uniref:Transmembrane protein n=1 Tax=Paramecium pentaurelia TaxID=43138 RepID=A0A8S1X7Y6_9CILI|nr:unnamed protein product [Paramecium pentaurelia]
MSLQFENSQSLKFIRLRIIFYIKGFLIDNRIQINLMINYKGKLSRPHLIIILIMLKKFKVQVLLALILMIQLEQKQFFELTMLLLNSFQKEYSQHKQFRHGIQKYNN